MAEQLFSLPEPQPSEPIKDQTPRPELFEDPGQNTGHVNPYDRPLSRTELLAGMTPEDIAKQQAINRAGAQRAREALNRPRDN